MTAPQDVILSEWFQRLQNICLQHILKQSAPFPSNPTACVWLVWTFIAALLNRNSYALISLICCLFSPPPSPHHPQKGFYCTLNHGGLTKVELQHYASAHTHLGVSRVGQCPSAEFPGTQSPHHLSNAISIFRATFGAHQGLKHPPLA